MGLRTHRSIVDIIYFSGICLLRNVGNIVAAFYAFIDLNEAFNVANKEFLCGAFSVIHGPFSVPGTGIGHFGYKPII